MTRFLSICAPALLATVATGIVALASESRAQDSRASAATVRAVEDSEFRITPFFWAAGMDGKIGVRNNTANVDQSFSDIWDTLDFAAMLAGEYRHGRWGVLADLTYVAVSDDASGTVSGLAASAKADVDVATATATLFYRFLADGTAAADVLAGARVWYTALDVKASVAGLGSTNRDGDEAWVDGVVGLRLRMNLGSGFGISGYGDIGTGQSDLTWQLRATIDYAFSNSWQAHIGYRHLDVDYKSGGFTFDVSLSGPILGVSYRF